MAEINRLAPENDSLVNKGVLDASREAGGDNVGEHAMFNSKPYHVVNREERHFACLLASALISNMSFRQRFFQRMTSKTGLKMAPDSFEIYLESASLRDFWHDLGDPRKYTSDNRRLKVINELLSVKGIDTGVIDTEPMFWTTTSKEKLRCPNQWPLGTLKDNTWRKSLQQIKWAFNAKPDMLIISDPTVCFW